MVSSSSKRVKSAKHVTPAAPPPEVPAVGRDEFEALLLLGFKKHVRKTHLPRMMRKGDVVVASPGRQKRRVSEWLKGHVRVEEVEGALHLSLDRMMGAHALLIDPAPEATPSLLRMHLLQDDDIEERIRVLLPAEPALADTMARIKDDNAAARVRFMQDIPCYTGRQIDFLLAGDAKPSGSTAARWEEGGKLFSVLFQSVHHYPAFQFRNGKPLPVIADILKALPPDMTSWQRAFWFVSSCRWLDGAAPYRRLDDREAVTMAATREREPSIG